MENNIYSNIGVGFELLDQNTHDKTEKSYSPAKETILKKLISIKAESQMCGSTLTLRPTFHGEDPLDMHRYIHNKILNSRIWKNKKYIFFAEYTKKGVLHYHTIHWDIYQTEFVRLMQWWRRSFGFAKVELEIRHPDCYIKYITKNYHKVGLYTIYQIK